MTRLKQIHITKTEKGWSIKDSDKSKAYKIVNTKAEAKKIAIDQAKKKQAELFIHDKYGKIIDRDSYGNDPFPPRDKKF